MAGKAREDHVHAFHMPIPQKFQEGKGVNITHQIQNVVNKYSLFDSPFKIITAEEKIISATTSAIYIYNYFGFESSFYLDFSLKDFAYLNNQILAADEDGNLLVGSSSKDMTWTKWNLPPDCVRCINVWGAKSYFLGLFQKEDGSFVFASAIDSFVYPQVNEEVSFVGEWDDSRVIICGQSKYWFPVLEQTDDLYSHALPEGIVFQKIVRTPWWSIALAKDSNKIFITNDIWAGYTELDVGIPSGVQITDIYFEASIDLFLCACDDGSIYYEIEDGISFVNYQSIKISDKAIVKVFVLDQRIFCVNATGNVSAISQIIFPLFRPIKTPLEDLSLEKTSLITKKQRRWMLRCP
jgi:hypothetical protein